MPAEPERLLEQACSWLSQMHSGEFSLLRQRQLAVWRSADPAHEQAWQQAQATWRAMEPLRGRTIPGSEPLLQERYCKRQTVEIRPSRYRRVKPALAAACCAVFAVALTLFYPPLLWQADYTSGKGERRTLTLADGSRVTLNTDSALAVRFDDAVRRVELLQGEAFFEVAKDAAHPFVVTAAGSEVRAVGTAFDVQWRSGQIAVELVEGIVDIQDAQRLYHERLRPGQTAVIGADRIALQASRQPESLASWRDGYLQFDGLPLQEAIAQINRYRKGRVMLLNADLADKRVSGLFRLDALDQAVTSLKTAVPELQIATLTPYFVVLR